MATAKSSPQPGSAEWQKALDAEVGKHDEQVQGTSDGQDFEIGGGK